MVIVRLAKDEYQRIVIGPDDLADEWVIELTEPGASVEICLAMIENQPSTVRHGIIVRHLASQTKSSQYIRALVSGSAQVVVESRVFVAPHIGAVESLQSVRALACEKTAQFACKPELEILSQEVSCTHGVSIGPLDVEQERYLRARGLTAACARETLLTAFFSDLPFYETIHTSVQRRLSHF